MTVGAKRLVEESLFFVSLFSRTRLTSDMRRSKYGRMFKNLTPKFEKKKKI